MHLLLLLAAALAAPAPTSRSSIEATIRGTAQPLSVELLRRKGDAEWTPVAQRSLPAGERRVRFDDLSSGAYQLRIAGASATERLATQIVVGASDARRTTVDVDPFELTGRITHAGRAIGGGILALQSNEFGWRVAIPLREDGTFRARLWQRGDFTYSIRAPTLTPPYSDLVEFAGQSPMELSVDLPAGAISGIVRDANSGAPVADAVVALQTTVGRGEQTAQTRTNAEGRFRFTALRDARHTVRVVSIAHLDAPPIEVELDPAHRTRELDFRLDGGRAIPIAVVDATGIPVADAVVFAVADAKLCARATTGADGRTSIAVPAGEEATLFVIPSSGAFGVQRVARTHDGGRIKIYLPKAASSLLIKAMTTDGAAMSPFALLMRFNGAIVPIEVADELSDRLGIRLMTTDASEALLQNIPSGSYEFWPYRTDDEAAAILASGEAFAAPIYVDVRNGENKIAVKFNRR